MVPFVDKLSQLEYNVSDTARDFRIYAMFREYHFSFS